MIEEQNCVVRCCQFCSKMFENITTADLLIVLQEIGEEADSDKKIAKLKDFFLKFKEYLNDKE